MGTMKFFNGNESTAYKNPIRSALSVSTVWDFFSILLLRYWHKNTPYTMHGSLSSAFCIFV